MSNKLISYIKIGLFFLWIAFTFNYLLNRMFHEDTGETTPPPESVKTYRVVETNPIDSADKNRVYRAFVSNLHYPSETDIEKVVKDAESSFKSYHYRNAIKKIHPDGFMPDKVNKIKATARLASEVRGFNTGIVADAEVWYCENPAMIDSNL